MRKIIRGLLVAVIGLVAGINHSFAEGTKQLRPDAADWGDLQIFDRGRPFMTYGCAEEDRLHIHVCQLGEKIYYGFRQDNNDVYYRIRDPLGNIVVDNGAGAGLPVPQVGEQGFIDTYNEAVTGPLQVAGAGGYDALLYTPTMVGDYYIEFNPRDSVNINNVKRVFKFFDITVTDASDIPINGRLWSREWDVQCNGGANRFRGTFFIYADDGIVTSVDLNGLQPYGFTVAANENGLMNTGNIDVDRQSQNGNINFPQYKIFLNDPDSNCYPTGTFGELTAPSFVTGCGESLCINIEVDKTGTVEIMLDLNGTQGYQPGTEDVIITADVVVGLNCVPWNGRNGLGTPVANQQFISMEVNYFNGLTHIPLFDIENNDRGYIVRQIRPAGPRPPVFWDDSQLPGGTQEINNGCLDSTGCHLWPSGNFGNDRTINTWWYANVVRDSAFFEYDSANVADANVLNGSSGSNDTVLCDGATSIDLNGGVVNATGGEWTGSGGAFDNDTSLTTTYTFSAGEISAGEATLILTTTGNGDCPLDRDTMVVTLAPVPTVNAGPDDFVCANNANMNFNGSMSGGLSSSWSGQGGVFAPNNTNLNITYTPSANEISAGITFLTLCAQGHSSCPQSCDTVLGLITPAPVVDAGADQIVCANGEILITGANGGTASNVMWTGGDGSFSPGANVINPTYTPGSNDISSGSVTLTLTGTLAGCNPVTDNMILTVTPAPTVYAGADVNRCENRPDYRIDDASYTVATGITWTTSGTGTFNNPNRDNPTYRPSDDDIAQGILGTDVIITATTTGNGICNAVSDSLVYSFREAPVVDAGVDQTVCENNATVQLNGTTNWTDIRWQSSDGSFIPNRRSLTPQYVPSATEIAAGSMYLVMQSHNEQGCRRERDTINITFSPAPVVDAGPDRVVCSNAPTATLSGSVTIATGGQWSGGNGTHSDINDLNESYTLSSTELSAGIVNLTLTSTGNADCNAETDQVTITVDPDPEANAGPDQVVCENNPEITLAGLVQNATGGTWSAGAGTFAPGATDLGATYTPTQAEINSGSVTFTLTTTGNGNCGAETDQMVASFSSAPTADAGADEVLCANNANLFLNGTLLDGTIIAASGGVWSTTGTGTFTPSASDLNANYVPSQADTGAGSVILILETTGNGNCLPETDSVTLSYTTAPGVDAGPDQSVCEDNPQANLNGTVTVSTGGIWTGGNGTFNPNDTTLSTAYIPTGTEIDNGFATLTLTSTGNGDCNAEDDNILITITPRPEVNAGPNQSVCGATTIINLNGSVSNATGGVWTTSGTGTFSANDSTLNAQYMATSADIASGSVTLTLTSTGNGLCNPVTDQMTITFTPIPQVDAGSDEIVCTNSFPIQLDASGGAGQWSGGSGTFTPNQFTLNATYQPSAAEITAGTVGPLSYCTFVSPGCPSICDDVSFTIPTGPSVNAGPDQNVCAEGQSINLAATFSNATGIQWATQGSGSFSDLFDENATYDYSNADINNGSIRLIITTTGNGSCEAEKDTVDISITPGVLVNAGPDQTFCASADSANLSGIVVNATGGQWTSLGSGVFDPSNTDLSGKYAFSGADITAGQVRIVLESTGNGICTVQRDTVTFTFQPEPVADPGTDHVVCKDTNNIPLSGTITNALGGDWSSNGTGYFAPNASTLNTSYFPSSADTNAGSVTIYLVSTGNGQCAADIDSLEISFTPIPEVSAGNDVTICEDAGSLNLTGLISIATGGVWSTTGTGTFSNPNDLNATYTPSALDINNGVVGLNLETTGNGDCQTYDDNIILTITPAPTADAGIDQVICDDIDTTNIFGQITIAPGARWFSSGSGVFDPDSLSLLTSYVPSVADKSSLSVDLYLETTNNGLCNPAVDTLNITFTPLPVVDAGPDQTVCEDTSAVQLSGTVTNATGSEWRSAGSGVFSPSINDLNATYTPSASDIDSGSVVIYLESTGNGACSPVIDSMVITINPAPSVDAGLNQFVCSNADSLQLDGSYTISGGVQWTTSGTGTFSPSDTDTNAVYIPSTVDDNVGFVVLTLTTTGNGLCNAVTNQMSISITEAPETDAGSDQTVCASNSFVSLNGSINPGYGYSWSGGSGTFFSNSTNASPDYYPTTAEKTSGLVNLILSSTGGNGICPMESDTVSLNFDAIPEVLAGADTSMCDNQSNISVSGTFGNAGGIVWTTSDSGSFSPSITSSVISYFPSPAALQSDSVVLTISTTGNGTCPIASDTIVIFIDEEPVVSAGPDQTLCSDFDGAQLDGTITNAGGAYWSSSGGGNFVADSTTIDAIYNASASDLIFGAVNLTLTSTGNGSCSAVTDVMRITIDTEPTVDAGDDKLVCTSADTINLTGVITNAGGGFWDVFGSGTFVPDNNSAAVQYVPSAADIAGDSLLMSLVTTGTGACNPIEDRVTIYFVDSSFVNAGVDQIVCTNDYPAILGANGSVGYWHNGSGTYSPDTLAQNAHYTPSGAEEAAGFVDLIYTSFDDGTCPVVSDTVRVNIQNGPEVDAGADITICADTSGIQLSPVFSNASGLGWTSAGSGIFTPDTATANAIYVPSAQDISDSVVTIRVETTGNGSCSSDFDQLILYINPAPTISVGADQLLCADVPTIGVSGQVNNAGGILWTSTGTGSFDNNTMTATNYNVTGADTTAGSIEIIGESTGNGLCRTVYDTIVIDYQSVPEVSITSPLSVCEDTSAVPLTYSFSNSSGVLLSSTGGGVFTPGSTDPAASYELSVSDTANGFARIRIETTGNGVCSSAVDTIEINIDEVPTINVGPDQEICSTSNTVNLSASFGNTTGMTWSTSGSGNFGSLTNSTTTYNLSTADLASGFLTLTGTSNTNGACGSVTDFMTIDVTPAPTANAGPDNTVCANDSVVELNGSVNVVGVGSWTTSGSGTFDPSNTTLSTDYIPSSADVSAGVVELYLTSMANGVCAADRDTMQLFIMPRPVVNPGPDETYCSDITSLSLAGSVMNAGGGEWSSSGTGGFSNINDLNSSYFPTATDKSQGTIILTLESTANGTCLAEEESVVITFTPEPTTNAGSDYSICEDVDTIYLAGQVTVATGADWSSPGGGTFSPSVSTLNAFYIPDNSDRSNGFLSFSLTSTGNGLCNPVTDDLFITFTPAPTVDAGPDLEVCSNNPQTNLNGTVSVATGGIWSGGSGVFTGGANQLNVAYTPTTSEISGDSLYLTLTSTGNGTCKAQSDSMQIVFTPAPVVTIDSTGVCGEAIEVQLNGTVINAGGGLWSSTGAGAFSPSTSSLGASYFPTSTDYANGFVSVVLSSMSNGNCLAESDNFNIVFNPEPVADAGSDQLICTGTSTNLLATSQANVSYNWFTTDGVPFSSNSLTTVTANTDTLFVLSVTDGIGCTTYDTVLVRVEDRPEFNMADYQCFEDSLIINSIVSNIPPVIGGFQWFRNDTLISGETDSTLLADVAGIHVVSYSFANCNVTDTTEVVPLPIVRGDSIFTCEGANTTLETDTIEGAVYDWINQGVVLQSGSQNTFVFSVTSTDTVIVQATDTLGCVGSDSFYVIPVPPPDFNTFDTTVCSNITLIINGNPNNVIDSAASTFIWYRDGVLLHDSSSIVIADVPGTYVITYELGECSVNDTSVIAHIPAPTPQIEREVKYCDETDNTVTISGDPSYTIFWSGFFSSQVSQQADTAGMYYLTHTSTNGCQSSDSIEVRDVCPPRLFVPDGMIVNGGTTHGMGVTGAHFVNYNLTIFNRWGEVIFHSTDPHEVWDGYYLGEPMPSGVYAYIVTYEGDEEEFKGPYSQEGSITVVR